jgi:hypothetical protein
LERLVKACDPATFGKNAEDVYDESYRKAKKLSRDSFMVRLDIVGLGLIKIIRENLLFGEASERAVRAELYNLNIYGHFYTHPRIIFLISVLLGEGSFFKAHVDTPRGIRMFGSLVILFPTSFEGGNLIMRKGENEWTFDAAQALAECSGPHVAYVALYSDVEHEVSMVTSGHRISITYNLYFDDDAPSQAPTIPLSLSPNALELKKTLETLLLDATFFPDGGWLGFNLQHKYPVYSPAPSHDLEKMEKCLKGTDVDIVRVAKELSLHVSARTFVSTGSDLIAFKGYVPDLTDVDEKYIPLAPGAVKLEEDMPVYWINKESPQKINQTVPDDVYGNQSAVCYSYESFCLSIEVGKPGMRTTPPVREDRANREDMDED